MLEHYNYISLKKAIKSSQNEGSFLLQFFYLLASGYKIGRGVGSFERIIRNRQTRATSGVFNVILSPAMAAIRKQEKQNSGLI